MTFRPIIRSQSELEEAWRHLMEPLGFSGHALWLMFIQADDEPIPRLTQIEDDGDLPGTEGWAGLAEVLRRVAEGAVPGGRVAVLRSRPGAGGITPHDRAWARGIYDAGRMAGVRMEVVHRACDADLVPIPMDEVLARSA